MVDPEEEAYSVEISKIKRMEPDEVIMARTHKTEVTIT